MNEVAHEEKIAHYEALETLGHEIVEIQTELDDINRQLDPGDEMTVAPELTRDQRAELKRRQIEIIATREDLKARKKRIEDKLTGRPRSNKK